MHLGGVATSPTGSHDHSQARSSLPGGVIAILRGMGTPCAWEGLRSIPRAATTTPRMETSHPWEGLRSIPRVVTTTPTGRYSDAWEGSRSHLGAVATLRAVRALLRGRDRGCPWEGLRSLPSVVVAPAPTPVDDRDDRKPSPAGAADDWSHLDGGTSSPRFPFGPTTGLIPPGLKAGAPRRVRGKPAQWRAVVAARSESRLSGRSSPPSGNAQELVWHCMAAQVQILMGTHIGELPAETAMPRCCPSLVSSGRGFLRSAPLSGSVQWVGSPE